jgi:hypothetical protein
LVTEIGFLNDKEKKVFEDWSQDGEVPVVVDSLRQGADLAAVVPETRPGVHAVSLSFFATGEGANKLECWSLESISSIVLYR